MWILFILADVAIWLGLYYLSAKAHIRKAEKEQFIPNLRKLRFVYILRWLIVHSFFLWIGIELVKWGGMD